MKPQRNETGKFDTFAWPGGYPISYLFLDGGDCCPACANGENGSEANENAEDAQWRLIDMTVHWEGPPLQCSHCGAQIESAYGIPEDED